MPCQGKCEQHPVRVKLHVHCIYCVQLSHHTPKESTFTMDWVLFHWYQSYHWYQWMSRMQPYSAWSYQKYSEPPQWDTFHQWNTNPTINIGTNGWVECNPTQPEAIRNILSPHNEMHFTHGISMVWVPFHLTLFVCIGQPSIVWDIIMLLYGKIKSSLGDHHQYESSDKRYQSAWVCDLADLHIQLY